MILACAGFTSGMLLMLDVSITNLFITAARTAIHGAYPVVGIYIGELYPTKFRATGARDPHLISIPSVRSMSIFPAPSLTTLPTL
jgi:hypothetical protein